MKSRFILIIDQEEAVRESLHLVLSEEGFHCFSAKDKADALNVLQSEPINLIILDSQTRSITRFLDQLKKTYPAIKIILLSTYAEVDITQQALALGADDFVLKPLDFEEFIDHIKKLMPSPAQ